MEKKSSTPIYYDSPSGWIDNDILLDWTMNTFVPQVKVYLGRRRALLIMDGHKSHTSQPFVKYLSDNNNIDIFIFPPNYTQYVQPLNCGVYSLFKRELAASSSKGSLEECVLVARDVWSDIASGPHIRAAWEHAGFLHISLEAYLKSRRIGHPKYSLKHQFLGMWNRVKEEKIGKKI